MIFSTKWFQIKVNDRDEKHYTLIGIFTRFWSAGIVNWSKNRPYNWRE